LVSRAGFRDFFRRHVLCRWRLVPSGPLHRYAGRSRTGSRDEGRLAGPNCTICDVLNATISWCPRWKILEKGRAGRSGTNSTELYSLPLPTTRPMMALCSEAVRAPGLSESARLGDRWCIVKSDGRNRACRRRASIPKPAGPGFANKIAPNET